MPEQLPWLQWGSESILGNALGGLFNVGGMMGANRALNQGRSDIQNLPGMQGPIGIGGNFGQVGANGQFQMDPSLLGAQQNIGASVPGMLQGGMFMDPRFQQAFQNNDIAGALSQANQGFSQQMGNTAFGQLGGLSSMLGGQVAGGPQDYSGGMMGNLMNQGFLNQQAAGNQSGLYNQFLNTQRQAAAPEFARQQQALEQSLFNKGMLGGGSTATGEGFRGLFEAQGAQDLGFQNNAFNLANQQQNFLANLGGQQMQQGQGFLGQNLGQFNQNLSNLQGIEGLGFNQGLQGMQFNSSQGMNRLNAAQGLFGLGNDVFGQNYGLGISGGESLLGFGSLGHQIARSPFELQASLLQGSGEHASAYGNLANQRAQASGGMWGGLASAIGGLFSDARLKADVTPTDRTFDGLTVYNWRWNEAANELGLKGNGTGVLAQEAMQTYPHAVHVDKSGYLKVDYRLIGV